MNFLLNIITPSARNNYDVIFQTILECVRGRPFRWYVVVDRLDQIPFVPCHPSVKPIWHRKARKFGGVAQANNALDQIRDGWIFFLDDDNIMHPSFYDRIEDYLAVNPHAKGFIYSQLRDGGILVAKKENVKCGWIDAAQFCLRRELFGGYRLPDLTNAPDGKLIEVLFELHEKSIVFIDEPLCYYNYLEPDWTKGRARVDWDKVVAERRDYFMKQTKIHI